ncbi:hypothetical protein FG386_002319 [Cryptosporidium ryanae]|uniref:uncharacterized protein n=1 Tax=Cryptosporidium ryanae TaxID=515981 RepID=UPI00351A01B4|nr:hypothetical protein FG386_002319 [Cryptosporidium ryanae]
MSAGKTIDDDELLFGEDVSLSKEAVEKRLRKSSKRRNNALKNPRVEKKVKLSRGGTKCGDYPVGSNGELLEKERKSSNKNDSGESAVITVEDDDEDDKKTGGSERSDEKQSIFKLNVKVYKRREAEMRVIKTLNVAVFRKDQVNKIVLYISRNLVAPGLTESEVYDSIKVYFDGDLIEKYKSFQDIGIEDEEQLDVKIPFESSWIKHPKQGLPLQSAT